MCLREVRNLQKNLTSEECDFVVDMGKSKRKTRKEVEGEKSKKGSGGEKMRMTAERGKERPLFPGVKTLLSWIDCTEKKPSA